MKASTIFRRIIAALGATLVLGEKDGFAIEAKKNDTNGDNAPSQGEIGPVLEIPADNRTTGRFVELFDLENASNHTRGQIPDSWVIPVSHWGCTEWTNLGDIPIRKAIQAMIDWSAKPLGWLHAKSIHYELVDDVGAFVCNCKYCCFDRAPEDEMWEFYERLRANCGGEGRSGWIFSKEWDKGYAIASSESIDKKRTKTNLCPPNCSVM
ncbi:hypothetical protein F4818DRAFT_398555 [Hypoxylon cercidicola]|nr:hypothetical protein F4818DRAFT_398555 [Hypoxylon cercidicola]